MHRIRFESGSPRVLQAPRAPARGSVAPLFAMAAPTMVRSGLCDDCTARRTLGFRAPFPRHRGAGRCVDRARGGQLAVSAEFLIESFATIFRGLVQGTRNRRGIAWAAGDAATDDADSGSADRGNDRHGISRLDPFAARARTSRRTKGSCARRSRLLFRMAVGPGADYYAPRFLEYERVGRSFPSWNWAALWAPARVGDLPPALAAGNRFCRLAAPRAGVVRIRRTPPRRFRRRFARRGRVPRLAGPGRRRRDWSPTPSSIARRDASSAPPRLGPSGPTRPRDGSRSER